MMTFDAFMNGDIDIFVIDDDGKNLRNITNSKKFDEYPSWSADGNHVVFTSRRDGNEEIYKINIHGGQAVRLTSHEASDLLPNWQPKSINHL
jgi:TolB protein